MESPIMRIQLLGKPGQIHVCFFLRAAVHTNDNQHSRESSEIHLSNAVAVGQKDALI